MINDISININNTDEYVEKINDIIQSWFIILSTPVGSVSFLTDFGAELFRYVDLPITKSFAEAANKCVEALTKWEPRTKIKKVTRSINGSQITINVYATYTSTGESIIARVDLDTIFKAKTVGKWILEQGTWDDNGEWMDGKYWKDSI
jgi:phage baseplate assembly protein W